MAVRKVLTFPDKRLRNKALPVAEFNDELATLVADMYETMYVNDGAGLAATQINVPLRVIVMDLSRNHSAPQCFINPEIIESRGKKYHQEGCLSVPGYWEEIGRADWVRFTAYNEKGEKTEYESDELLSVCIQHEIDHLDGKLLIDHLSSFKRNRILKDIKKKQRQS